MTLRACPLCGYRYNAPENQTCGKCKGWIGGSAAVVAIAPAAKRTSLIPGSLKELACYAPVLLGALFGFPSPIGMAFAMVFGLLMGSLMIKVVRLDMERFSKGLLLGIVAAAVFCAYLIFLLIFGLLFNLLSPPIQWAIGNLIKH